MNDKYFIIVDFDSSNNGSVEQIQETSEFKTKI
jgi:hypothetical protein